MHPESAGPACPSPSSQGAGGRLVREEVPARAARDAEPWPRAIPHAEPYYLPGADAGSGPEPVPGVSAAVAPFPPPDAAPGVVRRFPLRAVPDRRERRGEGRRKEGRDDRGAVRPADRRADCPVDPAPSAPSGPSGAGAAALLGAYRDALLARHFSPRTLEAYLGWTMRYLQYHGTHDVRALGAQGIDAFLTALARGGSSASTQNQARAALVHLLRDLLREPVQLTDAVVRARRPEKVPTVLSREEAMAVLRALPGRVRLPAALLYGSGLRLLECLQLRVKDVDLGYRTLTVRGGKGRRTG